MSNKPVIQCRRIRPESDADIAAPEYMTACSAGMDLCAAVNEPVAIEPGEIRLIPTGFAVCLPADHEAQIRPRSGLAVKHGIGLINSPGTIDADYRGEIQVAVINHGRSCFVINRGDRIAQMVISPVSRVLVELVERLPDSERSSGGFGHTGI
ncbi:MAG: dUTP diphosphatase [Desulfosalsimonas sp.]|uniref:dUTP diphosphatase n=1 Tax=Desulfosalsimonas sp. TaxID=3073848 RepID=UPI003970BD7E